MKTPKTQIIVVQILNILSPNKNRTNNPQATENKNVIYGFFIYSLKNILTYIIHSGFISGYQNRYGDNLKPPTNVYHRMTA